MGLPSGEDLARSQWVTPLDATTRKVIGAAAVELGPMVPGQIYWLRTDVDAFYLQGATGVVVTTATGYPIFGKEGIRIYCDAVASNGYVAVIASGAGLAWLGRVS